MSYTGMFTNTLTISRNDNFGARGTIQYSRVDNVAVNTADLLNQAIYQISGDLSAHSIPIAPLASSIGSNTFLLLIANQPIDVRLGESSHAPISGVKYLALNAQISGLFVTTGSLATTVMTTLMGGSNTTFTITSPLPT